MPPPDHSGGPQPNADSHFFPTWPPQWPEITESILQVLRSGHWGRYRGEATERLREKIVELIGCGHVRLVSSGSLGVESALRAAGISPGNQVALCGYDYPGNFRAIEILGARPLLVDADPAGFSVDPESLRQVSPESVKAVVVSHLYGVPAKIRQLREICDQKDWALIEDACQTPGMAIDGRPAGAWGDVAVLSFGGSKPLTAGNGGAVLTNNDRIASKLNAYLDRPSDSTPMSELQAAALLPQLDRLDECNRIRWETYSAIVAGVDWTGRATSSCRVTEPSTIYKAAFLTPRRDALIERLRRSGLPVGPGYRSMHRSSDRRCDKSGPLDRCRQLGEQLCLLDHAALLATGSLRSELIDLLTAAG
ncbi:DegT/DnrJ/EryC1/StrS family aminotransferase [Stieleria maiorica]|uniref:DegT/DnrJ/EryC1/StrS family aminotransferase n=1 Tax=Stieleria maiorica TaxID=2795974 RepID=UPI00142F39B1|nr:DegT/DnrJ/EryC1/StrS aminotransferase family protein [Stieleria maiorica]